VPFRDPSKKPSPNYGIMNDMEFFLGRLQFQESPISSEIASAKFQNVQTALKLDQVKF
jgi:hypothetical protein